jgi:outer membrane protein W
LLLILPGAASAQAFVAGLGGAAALSNGAAASAEPVSASNYDSKVGPALNLEVGYHFDDWFSFQAGYIWNQNRIVSTEVNGALYLQQQATRGQHALSSDPLLYFRPRTNAIRPYLSAGPAWVHLLAQDKLGLRVAVGVDLMIRSGWGFRYSFSEVLSANPLGAALRPPSAGKLMNFQNLFGVVKVF